MIKTRKIKPGREGSNARLTSLQVEELTDRPFFPSFLNKQQKVLQACRFDHVEKSFRKLIKKNAFFFSVSALIAKFLNIQTFGKTERKNHIF